MQAIAAKGESSSSPAGAALKRREPTPDHPPYSWMIGEAIRELGEGGGSAEAAISGFIRARHPGVPAAHDRFLRHYLGKHVSQGLFVCSAAGRYSLPLDDDDDEPVLALEDAPAPATEAKRGRGRPRKDGSAPTPMPAAGNKGRSGSPSAMPKRRGRPPKDASAAAAAASAPSAGSPAAEGKRRPGRPRKDGSSPSPSPAAGKNGGSKSPSTTPKRGRGRPRVLPQSAAAVDGDARITDMKDDGDAPSTTDNNHKKPRELPLVVINDGSTTPSVTEEDGGQAPSAKLPLLAKEPAAFTTPERSTQPCQLALVAAAAISGDVRVTDMKDSGDAPSTTDNNHGQPRELALVVVSDGFTKLSITGEEAPSAKLPLLAKEPAAFTTPERSAVPSELALVATDEGSAPPLAADKDGTQTPLEGSAPPLAADQKDGTEAPLECSPLVTDKVDGTQAPSEGSNPPLVADKEDGTQPPSECSALSIVAHKEDGTEAPLEGSAPPLVSGKEVGTQASLKGSAPELVAAKEDSTQASLKASASELVAGKEDEIQASLKGSAPELVANKDFTEPAFTKHKRRRRSAPVKATQAPAWTSIAENKAGGKAASAPPKGRGRQCTAAGDLGPRRQVKIKPRKMLFLNADVEPEQRMFCVLALPAPVPAATKA